MMFTKFQKVENTEVLTPEEHARLEQELHRLGHTSAQELTDKDRVKISQSLKK